MDSVKTWRRTRTRAARNLIFGALLIGYGTAAHPDESVFFDIPGQRADLALTEFAQQANISVLFPFDEISRLTANRLVGEYDIEDGLRVLLEGTGLTTTLEERRQFIVRVSSPEEGESEMSSKRGFFGALVAAFTVGGGVGSASGQESQAAPALLEEIVVTARRRTEDLQEVPVSVLAYVGEDIELRGMERLSDVLAQAPNIMTTNAGIAGLSSFAMRGIPDTGVFLDGIWQQGSDRGFGILLNNRSVIEIDRVEMLRGPQGTLFGRDTTGGAIRLYTRRPAEEFGMRVTATTGSYDRLDIAANVDIPITDTFFTKWTIAREERDGYQQSLTVDRAYGEIDDETLRGDFLWTPSDRLSFRLILEDSLAQTTHTSASVFLIDPPPPGPVDAQGRRTIVPARQIYQLLPGVQFDNQSHATGWPGGEVGEFETKADFNQGHGMVADRQSWTLMVEYDITDTLSFTSLTGWREQRGSTFNDFDASEFQSASQNDLWKNDLISQEFQFSGGSDRISWVGGAFIWEDTHQGRSIRWAMSDIDETERAMILNTPECQAGLPDRPCVIPPRGFGPEDEFIGGEDDGWAIFGEVTIDLTDTLSLTLGARQHDQDIQDWREQCGPRTPRRGPFAPDCPGTRDDLLLPVRLDPNGFAFESTGVHVNNIPDGFDADTYRFALTNQFTDDLMAYIGYSEGFNSGGTDRAQVPDLQGNIHLITAPFDSESIENYEIGLRSDWLGGRLRINATLFHTDWADRQVGVHIQSPFTGEILGTALTLNAAEAKAEGAEIDITGVPTERFRFNVGIGILDTGYTELDPNVRGLSINDKFALAPELQYSLGGQWDLPVANGGEVTLRLDYNWTDDYNRTSGPDTQLAAHIPGRVYDQESFGLLNARVVYRAPDRTWEVAAFGTNLTDEFYLAGGFAPGVLGMDYSTIGRPREAGVQLRLFFQ